MSNRDSSPDLLTFPGTKMAAEVGSESLLSQADSMWKMLDDLADSDPEAYKRFMDKTLKEGSSLFQPPEPCFCISTVLVSKYADDDQNYDLV